MTQSIKEAYEKIRYPSYLHSQTHPDRLATMAKLFGMKPAPVEKCRVLELGCADGFGLAAFAYDLPNSEFLGIDLAKNHIEEGNSAIRELGLKNIELIEMDLMKVDESFGKFDYIIAHGLIAWVPEFVREKIFCICSKNLSENGVAYISYNAYPGCHIRQMIRGMMRFHTRNINDDAERANQSASLVKFLSEITDKNNAYRFALKSELKYYESADIRNLLFDDLGEVNQPFYLHEFASQARAHNLQYLSEVNFFEMQVTDLPEETQNLLAQIREDTLRHQQYIDFVEGRRFHATLLCHESQRLDRNPKPEKIREFLFGSKANREHSTTDSDVESVATFSNERGARVATNNPLAKAALNLLTEKSVEYVSFDDLLRKCRSATESKETEETDTNSLAQILLAIFATGLISIHSRQPKLSTKISARPIANPIARLHARKMPWIPTLRCDAVQIESEFSLELLTRLDGTRDRAALCAELKSWLETDTAKEIFEEKERAKLISDIESAVDENLRLMVEKALLVS